jgi:PTH1 family peptidyl-tRNA hydrolase
MAYIILGLGNPGDEYIDTRHNTGRIAVTNLAKSFDFPDFTQDKKLKALVSKGKIGKESVTIILPETFMNKSGSSITTLATSLVKTNKAKQKVADKLVVIYDDFQLPIGKMKISYNRSSGGHNGLESVIRVLKTEAFPRIRIGISPATSKGVAKIPHGDKEVENFILGKFKKPEIDEIKKVTKRVGEAVEVLINEGREKAMSVFNG